METLMKDISCFLDCSKYKIIKVGYMNAIQRLCDALGFVEKSGIVLVRLVPEM